MEIKGWVICEYGEWNNSLCIENILVAENYRRKGIGEKLIDAVVNHSKNLDCRLIELETQNTNLPAIEFYHKQGFEITGLNLNLYNGEDKNEIAIFMSYDVGFTKQNSTEYYSIEPLGN